MSLYSLSVQATNRLYYGDNLEVLRLHVGDDSVDLIYLDPPFNSNANYNVLFAEQDGTRSAGQIEVFTDTWRWDQAAVRDYETAVEQGGHVAEALIAMRTFLGPSNMLAYLSMMAPRLVETRRVLKPTGSLYLHCDPTASHYLKLLLDAVFGPERFRSEIVWKRTSAHSDARQGRKGYGSVHDVILFYADPKLATWNTYYTPYSSEHFDTQYRHISVDGRHYMEGDCTAAKPGGDTSYEWRVKRPNPKTDWVADLDDEYLNPKAAWEYKGVKPYGKRYWAYSHDNMRTFVKEKRLTHRSTGAPRLMLFADEMPGLGPQDVWTDINPISAGAAERLGYQTQKPLALLERIIQAETHARGTLSWILSVAVARQSMLPSALVASGSASTSLTWRSTSSRYAYETHTEKACNSTSSGSPPIWKAPRIWPRLIHINFNGGRLD